ncbi:putative ras gtpase [Sesbania bispinosa]|nr:putative ras gtpase [Sesbania bispinosa]
MHMEQVDRWVWELRDNFNIPFIVNIIENGVNLKNEKSKDFESEKEKPMSRDHQLYNPSRIVALVPLESQSIATRFSSPGAYWKQRERRGNTSLQVFEEPNKDVDDGDGARYTSMSSRRETNISILKHVPVYRSSLLH